MTSLDQTARITNFPGQSYFNNLVLMTLSGLVGLRCNEFVCRNLLISQFGDLKIWGTRSYFLPSISTSLALAILLSKVAGMGWSTGN